MSGRPVLTDRALPFKHGMKLNWQVSMGNLNSINDQILPH